jgi:hypothetical protein
MTVLHVPLCSPDAFDKFLSFDMFKITRCLCWVL